MQQAFIRGFLKQAKVRDISDEELQHLIAYHANEQEAPTNRELAGSYNASRTLRDQAKIDHPIAALKEHLRSGWLPMALGAAAGGALGHDTASNPYDQPAHTFAGAIGGATLGHLLSASSSKAQTAMAKRTLGDSPTARSKELDKLDTRLNGSTLANVGHSAKQRALTEALLLGLGGAGLGAYLSHIQGADTTHTLGNTLGAAGIFGGLGGLGGGFSGASGGLRNSLNYKNNTPNEQIRAHRLLTTSADPTHNWEDIAIHAQDKNGEKPIKQVQIINHLGNK